MRAGELRDGQAIEAAAQILDGLAHAHSRGIVHRDVKPSNVLLAEDDAISVRLLDFGLAQFDEAETLTAVGDVPGTLAYISPERLRGEEACSASDIWAVGILLWEALAGKHPFWGVPLPQMAGTIEAGCPPLQPERPDLPKRLLSAISHALAHDPGKRPPAAALAKELRSALAGGRRSTKIESVYQTQALLPAGSFRPRSPGSPRSPAGWRFPSTPPAGRPRSRRRPRSPPIGRRAPGSRWRSPHRCCRSATTRSGWRCSTACLHSAGSCSSGGTRAGAWRSSPDRRSPPSGCLHSCRSSSSESGVL